MALPTDLDVHHRTVTGRGESNFRVSTVTTAAGYSSLGVDNSWNVKRWKKHFKVKVVRMDTNDMEFDLIGIDPAVVNALRRIVISEIPSVAFEHVFFVNNTSIIADEVLAHRIGLIPLNIDPDKLEYKTGGDAANERNTVVFKLKVKCTKGKDDKLINEKVPSSAFLWLPNGSEMPQETKCLFGGGQESLLGAPAEPVHKDILVAKMRAGQSIDLEAHATKGIGADHAKWSPVATSWYRLLPEVVLKQQVVGDDAKHLEELCPGLFVTKEKKGVGLVAHVKPARGQELHLEKIRHLSNEEKWRDRLELRKHKEHFIFTIESVGVTPPDVLFLKALDVLSAKCDKVLQSL